MLVKVTVCEHCQRAGPRHRETGSEHATWEQARYELHGRDQIDF